jgi:HAD superfamily hydrolase (TIGR01459 family)
MQILDGIADLAVRYDGFIFDLWGVVHDGREPFPGVKEALAALKSGGKKVVFLSNAPRRSWFVEKQLLGMGIGPELHDGAITSGELAWRSLRDRPDDWFRALGDRAFHIGPERDLSTVEELPITLVADPAQASFCLNTGPDPEHGNKSVEPYDAMLQAAHAAKLPMLCVNPDREVMVGPERLIAAGALADRYIALGGDVREIGKPDPAVYAPVLEKMGIADRARVLAIGDSPRTDLRGAQAAGIDAVWALTGLAQHEHGTDPSPDLLIGVAAAEGVSPMAALRALCW